MVLVTVGDSVSGPPVPLGTLPIPKTENLTEAFLREHYIGYKANIVEKDILTKYKGKGVLYYVLIIEKMKQNNYYYVQGLTWDQKMVDDHMKRSFPKVVRLYTDTNEIVTNILYR